MMRTRRPLVLISAIVVTIAAVLGDLRILNAWGAHGHTISGAAAARALPREMPKFFRNAADQLAYLTPEPDRWRNRGEAAAFSACFDIPIWSERRDKQVVATTLVSILACVFDQS